jgi:D-cysteine desulfhydrase
MPRLSRFFGGPGLFIKRDDQTGLASGGNKTRKLEFLIADALAQGCDHLVTIGSQQSNHCRQTAAAASSAGIACTLVLGGAAPSRVTGNLLLDELLGARLIWSGEDTRERVMDEVIKELRATGHSPYAIPLGGSNAIGVSGYVLAMGELMEQLAAIDIDIDVIVVASSSGGTQAGLVLGAEVYGFGGEVLGISIDQPAEALRKQVAALARETAVHLGLGLFPIADRVKVNDDYLGGGYAVVGEREREAIQVVARQEGILLDPVYTGRAMGGVIDLIRRGAFSRTQKLLFWHTGGTAALPAFGDKLV